MSTTSSVGSSSRTVSIDLAGWRRIQRPVGGVPIAKLEGRNGSATVRRAAKGSCRRDTGGAASNTFNRRLDGRCRAARRQERPERSENCRRQRSSSRAWPARRVRQNARGIPTRLASCFAFHVTHGCDR